MSTKSDMLIDRALAEGLYSADLATGIVTGRNGHTLAMPVNQDGYRTVTLFFTKQQQVTALVHRMVAIRAWGLEAVQGRQVAHRDGYRTHNALGNLWLPESVKEHNHYDGTDRNLVRGQQKCKDTWLPCVRCGVPDGPPYHGRKTPARISGARLGIEGKLCWPCYHALDERERRKNRKEGTR